MFSGLTNANVAPNINAVNPHFPNSPKTSCFRPVPGDAAPSLSRTARYRFGITQTNPPASDDQAATQSKNANEPDVKIVAINCAVIIR